MSTATRFRCHSSIVMVLLMTSGIRSNRKWLTGPANTRKSMTTNIMIITIVYPMEIRQSTGYDLRSSSS